jgi:5-methyltetrahydrofolate--homocysteine methyltransferase
MTNRKYTNRSYLDALEKKVLVFDGAMGTSLQLQNLTAEHFGGEQYNGCNDYLVISYPEAVEKVHRSFLEVGVDVIETDTFRSNRVTIWPAGPGHRDQRSGCPPRAPSYRRVLQSPVSKVRRRLHRPLRQTALCR